MDKTILFIAAATLLLVVVFTVVAIVIAGQRRKQSKQRRPQRSGAQHFARASGDPSATALPPVLPGYSWMNTNASPSELSPALAVYQVIALRNNQAAAFKMINPSKLAKKTIEQHSLEQQLALAQTVNHPHCAALLGSNVRAPIPYFIEEWLGGGSLQEWLRRGERMTEAELTTVLGQACDGLAYLHASNIVHGALTPAHIRFDDEGLAHIIHCGFARLVSDVRPVSTSDIAMITRSDLYALGIIAYQLAAGRLPFEHDQVWAIQQGKQAVPDPRLFNPALGDGCAQAILKSLHSDPAQRFQNARDMALAFGFGHDFHRAQDATRILQLTQEERKGAKKTRHGRPVPIGPLKLYNVKTGTVITIAPPRTIATRDLINPTDTLISRTNGEFVFDNNAWHLGEATAGQSTNGVYINEARVVEARPLFVGDQIRLGKTVLTVHG